MNEKVAAQDDPHRFEILTLAHKRQCEAIDYHNDLAFKIFSWSTTWLLAIAGYAISESDKLDGRARIFLAFAVIILLVASLLWQDRNRRHTTDHAGNLKTLNELLHLRTPGYFHPEKAILEQELHTSPPAWEVRFAHYALPAIIAIIDVGLLLLPLFLP